MAEYEVLVVTDDASGDEMAELIHNRGRGPEIIGTRITIYNLLPHFLDPASTEAQVCSWYELSPEQVAAARAYVLNNHDQVMAEHRRIEERLSAENPASVVEQTREVRGKLSSFKKWMAMKNEVSRASGDGAADPSDNNSFPTFQEWFADQERTNGSGRS